MIKLGERNFWIIYPSIKDNGTHDPNEIFFIFEESLYMEEGDEIWDFLEWCHRENKTICSRTYEQVFKEFLKV